MFPVSIRTPLWKSARNRGINARVKLQKILKEHFGGLQSHRTSNTASCPFLANKAITDMDDVANHVLLFTSGLANKALSSLLTSSILNIFMYRPHASSPSLAHLLRSVPSSSPERAKMLRSVLLETERLFPPVVGVLRRATQDVVLTPPAGSQPHTIPKGHEAWLYFSAASRSISIFGEDAELFRWDRFMHISENDPPQESFAFGSGAKDMPGSRYKQENGGARHQCSA